MQGEGQLHARSEFGLKLLDIIHHLAVIGLEPCVERVYRVDAAREAIELSNVIGGGG